MADTAKDTVTLTIDGVEVTVPKGTTILEAAKHAGVLIPHYCYHPGLPIAGVCRMCLVEVEKAPKLQIACATQAADGQVVKVFTDQALAARKAVLEFLLINHPLDCPICDQAGECELQDYVFQEGRANTRYTPTYPKRFNPVEDFGGDVLYVPNRCILCTRCVRFMDHVADDALLNVSDRGDRAVIGIHPERVLDHPWAGNVVDLCPVGSLLSKDFLHKARAWELDTTASVCTGCSQGCNVMVETRQNVVVRLQPRPNAEVNRYFMCDHGRLNYRWMNRGDRIEAPLVRQNGNLAATDWDTALQRAGALVQGAGGKVAVVASAGASNEALYLLRALAGDRFDGVVRVPTSDEPERPLAGVPNLALRSERAPNARGAALIGYRRDADLTALLRNAAVVIVLDDTLDGVSGEQLDGAEHVMYAGTVLPDVARRADVVLPVSNVVEEDGSFVNRDGRVQRYLQAKAAPGMSQPAWWVFGELLAETRQEEPPATAEEAFSRLSAAVPAFQGMDYATLGWHGRPVEEGARSGAGAAR